MSGRRLVIVGDALLDRDLDGEVSRLSPDAPVPIVEDPVESVRPGGAGLAAALAAADGERVTLVTALAADGPGEELRAALRSHGVDVVDLALAGTTPEKVRVRTRAMPLLRLDRGGAPPGRVGAAGPRGGLDLRDDRDGRVGAQALRGALEVAVEQRVADDDQRLGLDLPHAGAPCTGAAVRDADCARRP